MEFLRASTVYNQALLVAAVLTTAAALLLLLRLLTPHRWSGPYTKLFSDYKGFTPPIPEPDFDHTKSEEPRYRPFRWGQYQVTMGLRTIDHKDWLVMHTSYPSYIRLREARHEIYGCHSFQTLPSPSKRNELAALETARAIAGFMATRYPHIFQVTPRGAEKSVDGWDVRGIKRLAQPAMDLPEKQWTLLDLGQGGDDPMRVAGELTPDDLAVLLPEESGDDKGQYRFIAGSICTPGFWRLDEKLGMLLRDIHLKGKVAQYESKLQGPMDRWFSKLSPNTLAERNNYFFQVFNPDDDPQRAMAQLHDGSLKPKVVAAQDPRSLAIRGDAGQAALRDAVELSWSHSTNGSENHFDQGLKGSRPIEGVEAPPPPVPATGPESVAMRSERQSLRKLPRSGAVVFTIRTYLTPLKTMAEETGVPGRLASSMRSWPEDIAWYKGAELYRDQVLPYLDAKHQEQIEQGRMTGTDEEKLAAKRAYPL